MRIACPGCAAAYDVPATSLHPRRKVRCARCGTEWHPEQDAQTIQLDKRDPVQEPSRSVEAAPMDTVPAETAMERLAAASPSRPSPALRAAWVLTVLVLVGFAAAAVTWRSQVVHAWPASAWILGAANQTPPAPPQQPDLGGAAKRSPAGPDKPADRRGARFSQLDHRPGARIRRTIEPENASIEAPPH